MTLDDAIATLYAREINCGCETCGLAVACSASPFCIAQELEARGVPPGRSGPLVAGPGLPAAGRLKAFHEAARRFLHVL